MLKSSKGQNRPGRFPDEIALAREIRHAEWWDCLRIGRHVASHERSVRLFGNANVGNQHLTNLQLSQQFAWNEYGCLLRRWFIRTDIPTQIPWMVDAERALLAGLHLQVVVGTRMTWMANGSTLKRQADQPNAVNWPLAIPERQNIYVQTDLFSMQAVGAAEQLRELDDEHHVWVQFEGLIVPSKILDRVTQRLVSLEGQEKSVEQRIVDWIRRTAEGSDDAGKVQLEAICDGILEGRHFGCEQGRVLP